MLTYAAVSLKGIIICPPKYANVGISCLSARWLKEGQEKVDPASENGVLYWFIQDP